MAKKQDRWSSWLHSLPQQAQEQIVQARNNRNLQPVQLSRLPAPQPSEANLEFQNFKRSLDTRTQVCLEGHLPEETAIQPSGMEMEFMLVECDEGALPRVNIFPNLEALGRRMQSLEGEDTFVIPLYGACMSFSATHPRYLFIGPGEAMEIPRDGVLRTVELHRHDVDIQEDFFLGPEELAITPTIADEDEEERENREDTFGEDPFDNDDDDDSGEFAEDFLG